MRPEDYTADTICRRMGLSGLVEPGLPGPMVRVVLKPSFHPEVCLTLTPDAGQTRLAVVALTERFWGQLLPRWPISLRETVTVSACEWEVVHAGFLNILADSGLGGRMLALDGMNVEACLIAAGETIRWDYHVYRLPVRAFASNLIRLAWGACTEPAVRNALAACGAYLGADYPEVPVPDKGRSITRVLVLGTPEARSDFFEHLERAGGQAR